MSKPARILFIAVYILVGLGLVMTYSASAIFANHIYQNAQYFLIRQALYILAGTLLLFFASGIPIEFWQKNSRALILLAIVFMLLIFVPGVGHEAGGAKRWIGLGVVNFQPAEFAKVAVCLYLSDYLSRKIQPIRKGGFWIYLPPLLLIGVVCGLSLLQPDLGSCAFILMITMILFFAAGIPLRYVVTAGLFFLPLLYLLVIRVPYRLSRITAYLNPWEDPLGSGFQMIQSFVAFGAGGMQGVGLGQSTQKLFYLPSGHNDFIFAVIGEELGLLGLGGVILLFGIIFVCGMLMAYRSSDLFKKLLMVSLTLFFVMQAVINMMVATGLLPTKGLPLPFISYGGTSIVINLMAVGILLATDNSSNRN